MCSLDIIGERVEPGTDRSGTYRDAIPVKDGYKNGPRRTLRNDFALLVFGVARGADFCRFTPA